MDAALHLRVLDLDDSLDAQTSLRTCAAWDSIHHVPLRDLAARLRLWSRETVMQCVRERLADRIDREPAVTLIGSGDFHHLAVLLVERAREPVTLVHFDNHPDWVRWAPRWHCGSWVNRALMLAHVPRVLTIGPCSDDLTRPQLKGGNLAALDRGRIVLMPWRHAPSRIFGQIADGPGHRQRDGCIVWRNLADHATRENIAVALAAIETAAIWLTIDKDVLAESEALTNWDQGQMPLHALLEMIRGIAAQRRVIGADICGEFSPPRLGNPLKRIESRLDRPQRRADAAALQRNEATNRALLQTIAQAAAC